MASDVNSKKNGINDQRDITVNKKCHQCLKKVTLKKCHPIISLEKWHQSENKI